MVRGSKPGVALRCFAEQAVATQVRFLRLQRFISFSACCCGRESEPQAARGRRPATRLLQWRAMPDESAERVERLELPFDARGVDNYGVSKWHLRQAFRVVSLLYRNYF